jgi:hypothetical protein
MSVGHAQPRADCGVGHSSKDAGLVSASVEMGLNSPPRRISADPLNHYRYSSCHIIECLLSGFRVFYTG